MITWKEEPIARLRGEGRSLAFGMYLAVIFAVLCYGVFGLAGWKGKPELTPQAIARRRPSSKPNSRQEKKVSVRSALRHGAR